METHEGVLLGPDDKPELIGVTVEITHQTITAWHGPDVIFKQFLQDAKIGEIIMPFFKSSKSYWHIGNGRDVVW